MSATTFTLPAGKYYIGDPCYVISNHSKWIEFIESSGFFEDSPEAHIGEDKFWAYETAYGDGSYWCSEGKELPVDSGLIGIVPLSVVEKYYRKNIDSVNDFGVVVEFNDEFNVIFNVDVENEATHIFGNVRVYTNSCDEEDSYDEDEFEE
jgi:hypothetical protein